MSAKKNVEGVAALIIDDITKTARLPLGTDLSLSPTQRSKSRRTGEHCLNSTTILERSKKSEVSLYRGQAERQLPFADGRTLDQATFECPF
jgi:hypothetical protein